ncbi:hypothetical protein NQF78_08265 [Pseudomonas monsensis]|jgi:hypothetical protein|uniref:FlxA-like protein n=1 Tax=Pseudomonas monsensis TaxID=2745509 RepID=A0ABT3YS35_9PSED|nr:hypothetical protein [Pseudomonas monsensis]MCY0108301.1 hypothetical protein [Pseudomonas monsensis]MDZ3829113.1 hypothetical protein [Pseudomonas monsensis]QXH99517.1 hypothetical protein HV782_023640 [Pseudomonas monsensis]RON63342.1 hypothetical protein BK669_12670 [Pseudomonas fluorescens]
MTSISATAVNPYPVTPSKVSIRDPQEQTANPLNATDANGDGELRVNSADANIASVGDAGSPIEALKKQIAEAQKLLAEQQAQLASSERGNASAEQKAQQVMEIQTQIAVTASNIQVLQATLLQAMLSVDVHA